MKTLRTRLSAAGVKRSFLDRIVLPGWWEDSLAENPGGFREAAAFVCARLGFSMASLLDSEQRLAFANPGPVKYKKSSGVKDGEVCLATHYALGLARSVASTFHEAPPAGAVPTPEEWRIELLARSERPWVCLRHILKSSWDLGIPVLHLRNLPAGAKKPDALTTMVGDRPVIVVLNARKSPSWIAFIVAHELGHIHLKHLKAGQTLVDEKIEKQSDEKDEGQANDFASRLLTGHSDLGLSSSRRLGAKQLAEAARTFGKNYRISPGVAALNFGFTTGEWALANGAVSILEEGEDAGSDLKQAMDDHLDLEALSDDLREWITRATHAAG
jgi:Zn-dependent peptidase ImmA (M78 family)